MPKAVKIIGILVLIYVGVVILFESLLGYFQPQSEQTMVLITRNQEGEEFQRVVTRIESEGRLYAAVNHWPRLWYYRVLENPRLKVTVDGQTGEYQAVSVENPIEHEQVDNTKPLGIGFRILTGFPPRYFVRFDPVM